MVVNFLKSWIKENENKINNLFLYSLKNPMKITEMYKNIDENGTGQTYRDLKKFDEIMLIGSGKGVTSVKYIKHMNWKSKNNFGYQKANKHLNF